MNSSQNIYIFTEEEEDARSDDAPDPQAETAPEALAGFAAILLVLFMVNEYYCTKSRGHALHVPSLQRCRDSTSGELSICTMLTCYGVPFSGRSTTKSDDTLHCERYLTSSCLAASFGFPLS